MNGSSGAKRATSAHALDQSAEIDGKKSLGFKLLYSLRYLSQHAQTDLNKKSKPKQKTIKSLIYNPQGFK